MTESRLATLARIRQQPSNVPPRTDKLVRMASSSLRLFANPVAGASMVLMLLPVFAAGDGRESLPRSFNAEWCAYRTPHFDLLTDLPHRQALETVRGLNRFRRLFVALFPDATDNASLPLTMLVFRHERDFAELTGSSRYAGVTLPSMHEYRLLAARGQRGAPTDNAWHEYTHYLLRTRTDRNYPLWYEEGLASYLGAAELRRSRALLGKLPGRQLRRAARDASVSFRATIEADSVLGLNSTELATFYGKAWSLAHFILHGHEAGFPDLRPLLERYLTGTERDFEAAFRHSPESVGELLLQYLESNRQPRRTLRLHESPAPAPTRACLTGNRRAHELALSVTPLNPSLAIRVLESLPPAAKHLTALSRAVWSDRSRARLLVDRALSLAPEDPEANVQFAHLLVRGCAFSSASSCIGRWARAVQRYLPVLERNPGRYDAAFGLGVAYLHTGRAQDAMPYLRLAYEKMPWDVTVNFYLGEGYRIAGDPRAAAHLRNALNWTSDATWQKRAEFALQRLKDES